MAATKADRPAGGSIGTRRGHDGRERPAPTPMTEDAAVEVGVRLKTAIHSLRKAVAVAEFKDGVLLSVG